MKHDIRDIGRRFRIQGDFISAAPCGSGHINDTYVATYEQDGAIVRYTHQRINHKVFHDPERLMDNMLRVTMHQRKKLAESGRKDSARRALTLLITDDGLSYYKDNGGDFWRAYKFMENVGTVDFVETPAQAYQAAKAFGEFQRQLIDLPGARLHETIPDFHNTPKRFEALEKAIEAGPANRAKEAAKEIAFALKHKAMTGMLLEKHREGLIPERIVHNDTKVNNVLMDNETGEGLCVIDLDTVMPGLALYDFGDLVRTATSPAAEDERDLSKVRMRMPMFEALTAGYLDAARDFLTDTEKEYLAFSGKLITFEIGIRFLADFLMGDIYFKTHRPGHNLDRCRTQFKLVESLVEQAETMNEFVRSYD